MQESTRQETIQKPQQAENLAKSEKHKTGQSKYNPALPPVILPGGIEANIDLETGAKFFEIKSGKESETA